MKNLKDIKSNIDKLAKELSDIIGELNASREALTQAVANPSPDAAQAQTSTAARIMVLEAREKATRQAIERSEAEAARVEDLLKSKEYKEAHKKIAELEKFFQVEADEVHNLIFALRDRLQSDVEKYSTLDNLLRAYDTDGSGRYKNKDLIYLAGIHRIVSAQVETERLVKALNTPSKIATGGLVEVMQ